MSTRCEMRDLAPSQVVGSLREKQSFGSDRNNDSLFATARHEGLEKYSIERDRANGERYM